MKSRFISGESHPVMVKIDNKQDTPPTAPLFHYHHHHCIAKQPSPNNVCKHTGDSLQSNGSCLFVIPKRRKSVGCSLLPAPSPSLGRSHFVPAIYRAPCLQKAQTKCVTIGINKLVYRLLKAQIKRPSTFFELKSYSFTATIYNSICVTL